MSLKGGHVSRLSDSPDGKIRKRRHQSHDSNSETDVSFKRRNIADKDKRKKTIRKRSPSSASSRSSRSPVSPSKRSYRDKSPESGFDRRRGFQNDGRNRYDNRPFQQRNQGRFQQNRNFDNQRFNNRFDNRNGRNFQRRDNQFNQRGFQDRNRNNNRNWNQNNNDRRFQNQRNQGNNWNRNNQQNFDRRQPDRSMSSGNRFGSSDGYSKQNTSNDRSSHTRSYQKDPELKKTKESKKRKSSKSYDDEIEERIEKPQLDSSPEQKHIVEERMPVIKLEPEKLVPEKKKKKKKSRVASPSSSSGSSSSSDSDSSDSSNSSDESHSNSSSSSSSSEDEKKKRKRKKLAKKLKKKEKKKKLKRKQKKLKKKLAKKAKPVMPEDNRKPITKIEIDHDRLLSDIALAQTKRAKAMAPMSKKDWEKKQTVVRRVYDEESGRHRLIRGDGEIIEEIVSRERHKQINNQATRADGEYFQSQLRKK